jgi:hypothetical protein
MLDSASIRLTVTLVAVFSIAWKFYSMSTTGRQLDEYSDNSELGWPRSLAGSVHSSSWPEFAHKTSRWSTFEAPTFNLVFLPETEADLSLGVCTHEPPSRWLCSLY